MDLRSWEGQGNVGIEVFGAKAGGERRQEIAV